MLKSYDGKPTQYPLLECLSEADLMALLAAYPWLVSRGRPVIDETTEEIAKLMEQAPEGQRRVV